MPLSSSESSLSYESWWDDWIDSGSDAEAFACFAATPQGLIYQIDPFGEKSVVLRDYFYNNYAVRGVAVKGAKLAGSSSSSVVQRATVAVENANSGYYFYTLRNIDNESAFISCLRGNGEIWGKYTIPALNQFLALEAWPSSDNFLVGITASEFYLINLDTNPPSVVVIPSDRPLDKGLAMVEEIDDYQCIFAVPNPQWPRGINHFVLNRGNNSARFDHYDDYAVNEPGPSLPMTVRGLAFFGGKLISSHEQDEGHSSLCFYNDEHRRCVTELPITVADIATPKFGVPAKQSIVDTSIRITTRQYDADEQAYVGNIDELNIGTVQVNQQSNPGVVDMVVSNVTAISNVRLALVDYFMGSNTYGNNLLIGHTQSLSEPPTSYTPIVPMDEELLADDPNNATVGVKSSASGDTLESDYVFLSVNAPHNFAGKGYFVLRWFFDYEDIQENTVTPIDYGFIIVPEPQPDPDSLPATGAETNNSGQQDGNGQQTEAKLPTICVSTNGIGLTDDLSKTTSANSLETKFNVWCCTEGAKLVFDTAWGIEGTSPPDWVRKVYIGGDWFSGTGTSNYPKGGQPEKVPVTIQFNKLATPASYYSVLTIKQQGDEVTPNAVVKQVSIGVTYGARIGSSFTASGFTNIDVLLSRSTGSSAGVPSFRIYTYTLPCSILNGTYTATGSATVFSSGTNTLYYDGTLKRWVLKSGTILVSETNTSPSGFPYPPIYGELVFYGPYDMVSPVGTYYWSATGAFANMRVIAVGYVNMP